MNDRIERVLPQIRDLDLRHARLDGGAVEYLRELSHQSTLVYVMQFRSFVEFLLIAHVLVHEIGHHFGMSDDDMMTLEASVT